MTTGIENVRLFCGTAHPELAQEAADYLGIEVSPIKINKFSNENFEVQLGVSVRGKDVFVMQPLVPPTSDNLLQLLLTLNAARSAIARSLHAIIPYYSYGRSDKKDSPRISIGGRLVADLLTTAGAQHLITMTLHSPQIHGFFSVPTDHLTAHSVLVNHFKAGGNLENTVIVSPDIGNAKRAGKLATALGLPLAIGQKSRLTDETVTIANVLGDVRGKRAIIMDDEIATGGTIVELVKRLRKDGAESITVACTHGLFRSNAVERLNELNLAEVVTTNTVPLEPKQRPNNLHVLSVGHIFGAVIARTIEGRSVGALSEFWPDSESTPPKLP